MLERATLLAGADGVLEADGVRVGTRLIPADELLAAGELTAAGSHDGTPRSVYTLDVGEMTQLLAAAFEHTVQAASRLKSGDRSKGGIILLVDEADALAQSREAAQMHHEDRAGVNAFIRGIDRLANLRLPAAVIMCTNRLNSLDPAVRRRAADIMSFTRPNEVQRRHILSLRLSPLGVGPTEIEALVAATGARSDAPGFTFSDLAQRLLPAIALDAYPDGPIRGERALEIAEAMTATPTFRDEVGGTVQ